MTTSKITDERDLKWLQQRCDGMSSSEVARDDGQHPKTTINHRTNLIRNHDIGTRCGRSIITGVFDYSPNSSSNALVSDRAPHRH